MDMDSIPPRIHGVREEKRFLREGGRRVKPLHHFNFANIPLREQLLQNRGVKLGELPPGVGGVLVLNLEENDPPFPGVEEEPVRLAPAGAPLLQLPEFNPGTPEKR